MSIKLALFVEIEFAGWNAVSNGLVASDFAQVTAEIIAAVVATINFGRTGANECLDAYIEAAGIDGDKNGFIFRNTKGTTKQLTTKPMSRVAAWKMVQRRLEDVGFGCHSFRATCGTNYLENGGDLEVCQDLMGHADPRTTKLYDRRKKQANSET